MQPRIVVTGAAGFIGSNLIRALNRRGLNNIIAVDCDNKGQRGQNLDTLSFKKFIEKDAFYDQVSSGQLGAVDIVFHQGACSSTLLEQEPCMKRDNYEASMALLHYCTRHNVRLIYASSAAVYGNSSDCIEEETYENPLNFYGYTKYLFDREARRYLEPPYPQIVGLRYFNVYGPGETHKGKMASIVCQHFNQFLTGGGVTLFGEYGGYGEGEHRRDFVYVDDVVDVNLWFLDHPQVRGIFNVGSGQARSFNDVAQLVVSYFLKSEGRPELPLGDMVGEKIVRYKPFPQSLHGRYQKNTCASLKHLRHVGCQLNMVPIEKGIPLYLDYLCAQRKGNLQCLG